MNLLKQKHIATNVQVFVYKSYIPKAKDTCGSTYIPLGDTYKSIYEVYVHFICIVCQIFDTHEIYGLNLNHDDWELATQL